LRVNASNFDLRRISPFLSRYKADRRKINAATHAPSGADFFFFFAFLFVFRQSVECKRDRSTQTRHGRLVFLLSLHAAFSVYFWSAISLLRTMACCAGIRSETTCVLLESQHPRRFTRTRPPPGALSKEKEEEIARARSRPRAFGSDERDFDWQHPSDHPRWRSETSRCHSRRRACVNRNNRSTSVHVNATRKVSTRDLGDLAILHKLSR